MKCLNCHMKYEIYGSIEVRIIFWKLDPSNNLLSKSLINSLILPREANVLQSGLSMVSVLPKSDLYDVVTSLYVTDLDIFSIRMKIIVLQ